MVDYPIPAQVKKMTIKEAYELHKSDPEKYPVYQMKFSDYQEKRAFQRLLNKEKIETILERLRQKKIVTLTWTTYWDNDEDHILEWEVTYENRKREDGLWENRDIEEIISAEDLWTLSGYGFEGENGVFLLDVPATTLTLLSKVWMPDPELTYEKLIPPMIVPLLT